MSVSRFLSCKGQFLAVEYVSSTKPASAHKHRSLSKRVKMVARAGIDFARLASTREGIASGERGEVQPLSWGDWESFPYTIAHKGERYYRLYPVAGSVPTVAYMIDGVVVSKAEYMDCLTPSDRAKMAGDRPACITVKAENCRFPDATPAVVADDDATATDYPAVA